jgi:hypothetical protein
MLMIAVLMVLGFASCTLVLSWVYFRRYTLARPPIGVFNLTDVGLMIAGIVLVPVLYLALPTWLVSGLLILGAVSALFLAWEPVLRWSWAIWVASLLPVGLTILLAGRNGVLFYVANNLVLIGIVIGLSNLWAQSGLRARDAAILGGALTVYDLVVTSLLPLMDELFARLAGLPLAPLVAWPLEGNRWVGIGLGDLLLAALFPLVQRKAFGRAAGYTALALNLVTCAALLALPVLGLLQQTFPVMVVLGPLLLAQYAFWRGRRPERTIRAYLHAEPITGAYR